MGSGYILAVDGGASSTHAVLAATDGRVAGWGKAGPSNHLHGEAGKKRLYDALSTSIGAAIEMAERGNGAHFEKEIGVACAALGMTGVRTGSQGADLVAAYAGRILPAQEVVVSEDARTALLAAAHGGPGILVYAGTGSIGLGRSPAGAYERVGGWGYLIDDEGGAYKIGQAVLKAVYRSSDGRGAPTTLSERVLTHLGAASLGEAHTLIYRNDGLSRPELAQLATLAGQSAAEGDPVARHILEDAAKELARLAIAAARRIGDDAWAPSVYPSGGVFSAGRAILKPFAAALRDGIPAARVERPAYEPVAGAYFMGLDTLSVPLTDAVLRTFTSSSESLGLSVSARQDL